jgi:arabinose-5-phosphate isomerase
MAPDLLEKRVKEIMSLGPLVVSQELLVTEAINLMNERRVTLLFVHDSLSELAGLVHLHDCLRSEIY